MSIMENRCRIHRSEGCLTEAERSLWVKYCNSTKFVTWYAQIFKCHDRYSYVLSSLMLSPTFDLSEECWPFPDVMKIRIAVTRAVLGLLTLCKNYAYKNALMEKLHNDEHYRTNNSFDEFYLIWWILSYREQIQISN